MVIYLSSLLFILSVECLVMFVVARPRIASTNDIALLPGGYIPRLEITGLSLLTAIKQEKN